MIYRKPRSRSILLAIAAVWCVAIAGCATKEQPPQIMVTQLANYPRAALGPGCSMPILMTDPPRGFHQVAIVEGWGALDQQPEVDAAAKKQACETGADALLVVSKASQKTYKNIYNEGPNQVTEEENSGNAQNQHGYALHQQEYNPIPGEAGHTGYYLDTVAIVYDDTAGQVVNGSAPN